MTDQKPYHDPGWINIRKLAALDIVFHGPLFILIEFAVGVIGCAVFGVSNFVDYFQTPDRPFFLLALGVAMSWIGLNYVPLLLYAIDIVRRRSAAQEVAFELEHREYYARKYTQQSLLVLLPLVVPVLAITQEIQRRSRRDRTHSG